MLKRTNNQRAKRALKALKAYKEVAKETLSNDMGEDITDLLADLHHLLLSREICLDRAETVSAMCEMVEVAADHFEDETNPEGS